MFIIASRSAGASGAPPWAAMAGRHGARSSPHQQHVRAPLLCAALVAAVACTAVGATVAGDKGASRPRHAEDGSGHPVEPSVNWPLLLVGALLAIAGLFMCPCAAQLPIVSAFRVGGGTSHHRGD